MKSLIKEQELKLKLRKNDYEKVSNIETRKELMKHKEKIESIFRQKLEDEKRKILKQQMEEFEGLVRDNRELKEEVGRLKVTLIKLN